MIPAVETIWKSEGRVGAGQASEVECDWCDASQRIMLARHPEHGVAWGHLDEVTDYRMCAGGGLSARLFHSHSRRRPNRFGALSPPHLVVMSNFIRASNLK
jgi:hypothetical protein